MIFSGKSFVEKKICYLEDQHLFSLNPLIAFILRNPMPRRRFNGMTNRLPLRMTYRLDKILIEHRNTFSRSNG